MVNKSKKIIIIGAGRVGTALAVALKNSGYKIHTVVSRRFDSAKKLAKRVDCKNYTEDPVMACKNGEILFITTPDDVIEKVCKKISSYLKPNALVIHTSGALSSGILKSAKKRGASVLSMHPCQSFGDTESAFKTIPGSYFCLEGDKEAIEVGKRIVLDIGCHPFVISSDEKPLYHIACCILSNYLFTTANAGIKILESLNIKHEEALKISIPLIKGTVHNIEKIGIPDGLTGPIERGDIETIRRHIQVLKKTMPEFLSLYKKLGIETLKIAKSKGSVSDTKYEELLKTFGKEK